MPSKLSENVKAFKQVPAVEGKNFVGLSLKPDVMNRPPNSWQQLDDVDLFVEGSIRNLFGWQRFGVGQTGAPYEVIFEYRPNDSSLRQTWGYCSTRGTLNRLDDFATPVPLASPFKVGSTPWIGLLPGIKVPFDVQLWRKNTAYTITQAVVKFSIDGRKFLFQCSVAGTSGTNEPSWPASGNVLDGSVTWTNVGDYDSSSFAVNYSVLVGEGGPMQKFDGTTVTLVGVSEPKVQVAVLGTINTTFQARGVAIQFGRLYAWTWFNPTTLVESSPSPLTGIVTFFSTSINSTISQTGCFLGPSPSGQFYASVQLGLPLIAANPPIGSGFTHVRIYATHDGGAEIFLVPTLYDANSNIITDANSAVRVSSLQQVPGYSPLAVTQAPANLYTLYDGAPNSAYGIAHDIKGQDNGAIQGIAANSIVPQSPGILPGDANASAIFDGYSAYIATFVQVTANLLTQGSLFAVFRTTSLAGGPLINLSDVALGTPGSASNLFLYLDQFGEVVFGYWNGTTWKTLVAFANYADGNTHDVMVGWGGGLGNVIDLYVDGVVVNAVNDLPATGINGYWRIGGNALVDSTAFDGHRAASRYFSGSLAMVASWEGFNAIGFAPGLHAASQNGTLLGQMLNPANPSNFWPLNDIGNPASLAKDASLVLPGPTIGENDPPPDNPVWATVYSGSLYVVDSDDKTRLDYANPGGFEQFGLGQFILFPSKNDAPITSLVDMSDRLLVGTTRGLQQLLGSPGQANFGRFPLDAYHGIVGKQMATGSAGQLIGLIKQGIVSFDMTLLFGKEPGAQLEFSPYTLIGNDIQPLTVNLDPTAFSDIDATVYDTTANRILFLVRSNNASVVGMADEILSLQIGVGFHRIIGLPGQAARSIAEVAIGDESNLGILISDANGQIWQLLSSPIADQSGRVQPQAQTQALPLPEQIGPELRDTQKVFRYVWLEGEGLTNWLLDWSVNGGASFKPNPKQQIVKGVNRIGDTGTQIILRFTRSATAPVAQDLISYYKLEYEIEGRTQS